MVYLVFEFLNLEVRDEPAKKPKAKSKKHNNKETEEKAEMIERPEDGAKVIKEFEEIIRSNKKNILWLSYHQSIILQRFNRERNLLR